MPTTTSSDYHDGNKAGGRWLRALLLLAALTGLAVSIFIVIEEFCLVKACRDTAAFSFFGLNMGILGILYFCAVTALLLLRSRWSRLDQLLTAAVFSGVGGEIRLIWIQKYVIGSWCPLCVTVGISLGTVAALLIAERLLSTPATDGRPGFSVRWLFMVLALLAIGLAVATAGVREFTYS
ncbi:vitamin K epoxide reductase family protein [Trichlorobacter ammonificans]|uniref:Vitamin K epoxide reductase domain-containing protein n=1 Tax=Trichlorobacter ammonificans TaxID=2916410 RepID=A0ABN8HKX8_9BACT|nr:vitamin K epoxide reductase family protein [Trichlorobacter ammonificans]CAH2031994.1 conserved membrane protein of unknown function [Trichlorobacter ammonificans]